MHVEYVHEHANPRPRCIAHGQFGRWYRILDHLNDTIGGANDKPFACRRYPVRISKEINTPASQHQPWHNQRHPKPPHQHCDHQKDGNKRPSLAVNWNDDTFQHLVHNHFIWSNKYFARCKCKAGSRINRTRSCEICWGCRSPNAPR